MSLRTVAEEFELPLYQRVLPGASFAAGAAEFGAEQRQGNCWFARTAAGVELRSTYERQGDVLVIQRTLRNAGPAVTKVTDLALLNLALEHPVDKFEALTARGGTTEGYYPPEAYRTRHVQLRSWLIICSDAGGRSSNQHLPLIVLYAPELQGGIFGGIEWSAHWRWRITGGSASTSVQAQIPVVDMQLEPGEELALPAVHLGFFRGTTIYDGATALRRHIYGHVCPRYEGQPCLPRVSYDSWFGVENKLTFDLLRRQVDRAAELGVEMFVHDAAWFAGGFPNGVGNWHATSAQLYPDGLEPLAEYVRSKGMHFGLWFEIERAAHGTSAVTTHPEMFIIPPDFGPGKSAHLNLARRDAQDWAIDTISGWIQRLDIRWSRWDYNIDPDWFWRQADPTLKIQFPYMQGLYRVLDTLMARHPQWMVEACASGGRRIDLGTLRRAHTIWFSDETMAPEICRWMQARANVFLPGHLLNSSVAVCLGDDGSGMTDTHIVSRMLGKLSFDGAISDWTPAVAARAAKLVTLFKKLRHLFVQDFHTLCPLPRLPAEPDAVQFSSRDGREHAVFVFAGAAPAELALSLQNLAPGATWQFRDLTLADGAGGRLDASRLHAKVPARGHGVWHLVAR